MSIFNEFPYTNFHELNLDWVIKIIKGLIADWQQYADNMDEWKNNTDQAIDDLKNYVIDYFDNLDVSQEISDKLEEMLQNGELEQAIINMFINMPFAPDSSYKEQYKNMIAHNAASFLASGVGLNSVVGVSNIQNKVAWVYTDGNKGYMSVLGMGNEFVYTDVRTIDDITRNVGYLDCSQFLSLLTRGRDWEHSPYKYAFENTQNINQTTLRELCLEYGSLDSLPQTFDFMNYIYTARMAYIMDSSGNHVKLVSTKTSAEDNILEPYFDQLEDGDVLFAGNIDLYPSRYLGIHHCMLYFKDLSRLNRFGAEYGVTFTDISDGYQAEKGYILHCTGSSATHINTLRIETFQNYANTLPNTGVRRIYACKPYSNSLNSNKAARALGFGLAEFDSYGWGRRYGNYNYIRINERDPGRLIIQQLQYMGARLPESSDLNTIPDGYYFVESAALAASITNKPPFTDQDCFEILTLGTGGGTTVGFQLAFSGSQMAYRRHINLSSTWDSWHIVNIAE